jgi:hypothetical protein
MSRGVVTISSSGKGSGAAQGPRGISTVSSTNGKTSAQIKAEQEKAAQAKTEAERMRDYNTGRALGKDVAWDFQTRVNPAIQGAKKAAEGFAPDETFRQYQLGLAQQLQAQARGEGPSLAQMQLAQATDRSLQQALGAARSGLGSNPALAARTAALQASGTMGNAASQSAMLRLQEQQDAQRALAGLSGQARGMDLDTASTRAGLGMDASRLQGSLLGQAAQAGAGIASDAFNNRFQGEMGYMEAAEARRARREKDRTKYQDAATKAAFDGLSTYVGGMYKGGMVPEPKGYACGGKVKMSEGGRVPALSAKGGLPNDRQVKLKEGDHPENDIVPAMLSPGEIVIPRSKAKDPKKAAAFAAAIAKRAKKEV